MAWKVEFDPRVLDEDFKTIGPSNAKKVLDFFERLKSHPGPVARAKPLRGILKGRHRYRIDDLRAIVTIRKFSSTIVVIRVGHRKSVYE